MERDLIPQAVPKTLVRLAQHLAPRTAIRIQYVLGPVHITVRTPFAFLPNPTSIQLLKSEVHDS